MSDNTLDTNEDTGASETNQAAKTYTQEEFDRHMAGLKRKFEKKYEGIDVEEYRSLKAQQEQAATEQSMKRGEFEKILQEKISAKDAEIQRRDSIIKEYKIDMPLLNAAAKFRAVNAEQVKALLKSNVRLNPEGEVEVVDDKGTVRYTDSGTPFTVDDLVKTFLDSSPHFVQPTVATTNTKSNVAAGNPKMVDVASLDLRNPEHRKKYKELTSKKVR